MKRTIKKYSCTTLLCIAVLLCTTGYSSAQIELSSGIDMSYPFLLNSSNTRLNYDQISFGLRFGIAYKPPQTQFFPILNVSFGRTRLPIKQFDENVAALNFNYLNVMANENYIIRFPTSEIYLYGGVGFSYLMPKGITITGPGGGTKEAVIDSTFNLSNTFPAINLGFEYNYGDATGKDLYLTMGINVQYILLLAERNTYYISIYQGTLHNSYVGNFTGNVISPGFYIAIHYLLHRKKGSSMYL